MFLFQPRTRRRATLLAHDDGYGVLGLASEEEEGCGQIPLVGAEEGVRILLCCSLCAAGPSQKPGSKTVEERDGRKMRALRETETRGKVSGPGRTERGGEGHACQRGLEKSLAMKVESLVSFTLLYSACAR